jgi:hypothetical protein
VLRRREKWCVWREFEGQREVERTASGGEQGGVGGIGGSKSKFVGSKEFEGVNGTSDERRSGCKGEQGKQSREEVSNEGLQKGLGSVSAEKEREGESKEK